MTELLYCPKCKQPQPCIKKGFKKSGEQLHYCKVCKQRFVLHTENQKIVKQEINIPTNKKDIKTNKLTITITIDLI